jgi:hypothetical protein
MRSSSACVSTASPAGAAGAAAPGTSSASSAIANVRFDPGTVMACETRPYPGLSACSTYWPAAT